MKRNATPDEAWRVAIAVVRADLPKLGRTQDEQAAAIGMSPRALADFLANKKITSPDALRRINARLGWPRGYLERIIKGDPAVIEQYEMDDRDLQRFTLSVFDEVVA
jgi:hypothetical protein